MQITQQRLRLLRGRQWRNLSLFKSHSNHIHQSLRQPAHLQRSTVNQQLPSHQSRPCSHQVFPQLCILQARKMWLQATCLPSAPPHQLHVTRREQSLPLTSLPFQAALSALISLLEPLLRHVLTPLKLLSFSLFKLASRFALQAQLLDHLPVEICSTFQLLSRTHASHLQTVLSPVVSKINSLYGVMLLLL